MKRRLPMSLSSRLLVFVATLVPTLAGCASPGGTMDGPPKIPPQIDEAHIHFAKTEIAVGDVAPDFTLRTKDARSQVTLSDLRGRPVVLVFGSYT